jgi:hypothetical protein
MAVQESADTVSPIQRSAATMRALFVVLTAFLTTVASVSAQTTGAPAAVFTRYVDAYNRGDVDGVVTLFADDASILHGMCTAASPCTTRAAIRAQTERDIAGHIRLSTGDVNVAGDTLTLREEIRNDAIRAAGLERIVGNTSFQVRGDQIVSVVFQRDVDDPQTSAFIRVQQAQAVPRQLPRTGEAGPPLPLWLILLGGAAVAGLGLAVRWRSGLYRR